MICRCALLCYECIWMRRASRIENERIPSSEHVLRRLAAILVECENEILFLPASCPNRFKR